MQGKIRIDKTKVADAGGRPLTLYHVTDNPRGIGEYFPLSHFGTQRAAEIHAKGLMEKAAGKTLSLSVPDPRRPVDFRAYAWYPAMPPLSMQKVRLYMRRPLAVPDLSLHGVAQWREWFLRAYAPKRQFLSRDELHEAWGLKPHETRYKKTLAAFIFDDSADQRNPAASCAELRAGRIFSPDQIDLIRSEEENPNSSPTKRRRMASLSEAVAHQRLIRFLAGEGYDGFSYRNLYEDKGSTSYMIMYPAQVFNWLENDAEHAVPAPCIFDKRMLEDAEKKFFQARGQIGPSERLIRHALLLKSHKKTACL